MQTNVKICGLTRQQDVRSAIDAGADYLGFIIEANSPRRLSLSDAAALIDGITVPTVAVTVDPDDALIAQIKTAGFTHIQLHGSETLHRTAEISNTGLSVIKACPVATTDDIKLATEYSGAADLLLFDAKPPEGTMQRGGHGAAFDWTILKSSPTPKQYALAGGLKPETVRMAVQQTGAAIVDVSSGVEAAPGIKDARRIEAFMDQLRDLV
jgi:phosphoribosylanthranilate isomerase